MTQHPAERELRKALPTLVGDPVEPAHPREVFLRDFLRIEPAPLCRTGVGGHGSVEVSVGQQPLREWGKYDTARTDLVEHGEETVLDVPVEHVVPRLVQRQGNFVLSERGGSSDGLLRAVVRHAHVERLSLLYRRGKRPHRLFDRGVGVRAVGVEDVDVIEAQPSEALVERREHGLARPPFAIGPVPHPIARLARDNQLVAVRPEVLREDLAEIRLGRTGGRSVVVRQVEMGDAKVEGTANDGALGVQRPVVAEVVP